MYQFFSDCTKSTNYIWYHRHFHVPQFFSIIIILLFLRVFHTSVSWWFSTEVWVTANHLKSPRLFSAFWPISVMLYFEWFPFVFLFPSPPVSVSILLVTITRAPITIVIIVTFMLHSFFNSLERSRHLSFFRFLWIFLWGQPGQQSQQLSKYSFSCWSLLGLVVRPRLGDPFLS